MKFAIVRVNLVTGRIQFRSKLLLLLTICILSSGFPLTFFMRFVRFLDYEILSSSPQSSPGDTVRGKRSPSLLLV